MRRENSRSTGHTFGGGLAVLALVLAGMASEGAAETTACTPITSLPARITAQGVYCLTGDLATGASSGQAIAITAPNVVLDLNGHKIGGLAAGPGTGAFGVYVYRAHNVTIRNGTIRGFIIGVFLLQAQAAVVEDLRLDQNTAAGVFVNGDGAVVRRNQIVATGGNNISGATAAILAEVSGSRIVDNDVVTVTGAAAYGILLVNHQVIDNLVVGNRITGVDRGIWFEGAQGKYRDNLTSGVRVPYMGGTDAGNNQ